jgi:DNA-binding LacI/PurR family transcriptional regulator
MVRTDDEAGSRLAVEHLAGLGHQSIAHVDGQRAPGAAERRRGYRATMAHLGLDPHARVIAGGLTEQHGERAAAQLLAPLKPTPASPATETHRRHRGYRVQRPLRRGPDGRRPGSRRAHT